MASKLKRFISVYLIMHLSLSPSDAISMSYFEKKYNGPDNQFIEQNQDLRKIFLLKQT